MATLNLPVCFLNEVIDVDDQNVVIPVSKAISKIERLEKYNSDEDKPFGIRTLYTNPVYQEDSNTTEYTHDYSFINKIEQKTINALNTNSKYYKMRFKFYNDITIETVVPSHIMFYSTFNHGFIPLELVKKSDLLVDYAGRMVQICKKTAVENIEDLLGKKYYSIQFNPGKAEYSNQIYLNGILCCVRYHSYDVQD